MILLLVRLCQLLFLLHCISLYWTNLVILPLALFSKSLLNFVYQHRLREFVVTSLQAGTDGLLLPSFSFWLPICLCLVLPSYLIAAYLKAFVEWLLQKLLWNARRLHKLDCCYPCSFWLLVVGWVYFFLFVVGFFVWFLFFWVFLVFFMLRIYLPAGNT